MKYYLVSVYISGERVKRYVEKSMADAEIAARAILEFIDKDDSEFVDIVIEESEQYH
jgi:macrodomain Ter protein organizer (MatP/YcbG family)